MKSTVAAMVRIYCAEHHASADPLCATIVGAHDGAVAQDLVGERGNLVGVEDLDGVPVFYEVAKANLTKTLPDAGDEQRIGQFQRTVGLRRLQQGRCPRRR